MSLTHINMWLCTLKTIAGKQIHQAWCKHELFCFMYLAFVIEKDYSGAIEGSWTGVMEEW